MSINLHCKLVISGRPDEEIPLMQTPTVDTLTILGKLVEVTGSKKANKTRYQRSMYSWQVQAKNYLDWVTRRYGPYGLYPDRDVWKAERKKSDEFGGLLNKTVVI